MRQKIKKIPEFQTGDSGTIRGGVKKKYGWLFFGIVFFWTLVAGVVFILDPKTVADVPFKGSFLIMGLLLFVSWFLSLSLLFLSARSGLWWSGGIVLFLYLRLWGLGNFANGLLILGILLCVEFYLRSKGKRETENALDN